MFLKERDVLTPGGCSSAPFKGEAKCCILWRTSEDDNFTATTAAVASSSYGVAREGTVLARDLIPTEL